MKVLVIRSSFQSDGFVNTEYAELFGLLKKECDAEITILGEESGWSWLITSIQSNDFVMVETGGVENLFKKIWSTGMLKTTTLIADGRNNSLAAALEILSFLSENGSEGRIIHGSNEEIARNVKEAYQETYNQLKDKIERYDNRIAEFADREKYADRVKRLVCLEVHGIEASEQATVM